MEFLRLNENWNAEPNAPNPHIEITRSTLKLSFYLNPFLYSQFREGDIGILEFHNCFQYRAGVPSDEGFYVYKQSRYKQYGVEWGHFYIVNNSDWEINFPDALIVDSRIPVGILKHYLFYFRDETVEVVAENYRFRIIKV